MYYSSTKATGLTESGISRNEVDRLVEIGSRKFYGLHLDNDGIRQTEIPNRPYLKNDKTPLLKDSPASVDMLGRRGFVNALATWIDRYWEDYKTENTSFIINIHGQWGAGKTTFVRLLEQALKQKKKHWFVIWVNAWENNHIQPVWWPVIDQVYHQGLRQIPGKFFSKWRRRILVWIRERARRLKIPNLPTFLGFVGSLAAFVFIVYWAIRPGFYPEKSIAERVDITVKAAAGLLALLSTVFQTVKLFGQSLAYNSAKNAEDYLQVTPDPLKKIKHNFDKLIRDLDGPILIVIDDLDRCESNYMVSLLECLQTILNHPRVFYIIPADQRWITTAFEDKYKSFKGKISEPGKPLGYLFLEKIFQLSLSLPDISNRAKTDYLNYLVKTETIPEINIEEKREELEEEFENVSTESQLIIQAAKEEDTDIEAQLRREVAVEKSASIEIQRGTEHFLMQFVDMMESNPRSMKRLVTYYGILRAVALLTDVSMISDVDMRTQLALWVIIKLRWPDIADHLEEFPDHTDDFISGPDGESEQKAAEEQDEEIPESMKQLINNEQVKKVFKGVNDVVLDKDAIERFNTLKSTGNIL